MHALCTRLQESRVYSKNGDGTSKCPAFQKSKQGRNDTLDALPCDHIRTGDSEGTTDSEGTLQQCIGAHLKLQDLISDVLAPF